MINEKEQYEKMEIKQNIIDSNISNILGLIEGYDLKLGKHCKNVGNLAYKICISMNQTKEFTNYCTICGYIHDIGKVGISKEILNKKGKTTEKEREEYKSYMLKGYKYCMDNPQLREYAYFIKTYHENLNEEDSKGIIPLESQIIKVANEFEIIRMKHNSKDYVGITHILTTLIRNTKGVTGRKENGKIYVENKIGKYNRNIVKALIYVILDEIHTEIIDTSKYLEYLKGNIERIKAIYKKKNKIDAIEKTLVGQEKCGDFQTILAEYRDKYNVKELYYNALVRELKMVKKLKILK